MRAWLLLALLFSGAASAGRMSYHGGPLQGSPRYRSIYWGPYWQTRAGRFNAQYLDRFFAAIAASASYASARAEYSTGGVTLGPGALVGSVRLAQPVPQTVASADIAALVQAQIAAGALPPPAGVDDTYAVFLPPDIAVSDAELAGAPGFHEVATTPAGPLVYLVVHYDSFGAESSDLGRIVATATLSHELQEAATDPTLEGWWAADGESADLCVGAIFPLGIFTAQKVWSDEAGACIAARAHPRRPGALAASSAALHAFAATGCASAAGTSPLLLLLPLLWRRRRGAAAFAALLLLGACSKGAPRPAGQGDAQIAGSVAGRPLQLRYALAMVNTAPGPDEIPALELLFTSDATLACDRLLSGAAAGPALAVSLAVERAGDLGPPSEPSTLLVGPGPADGADPTFAVAELQGLQPSLRAASGVVTIETLAAGRPPGSPLTGSADVTLESGDRLAGRFSAAICPLPRR